MVKPFNAPALPGAYLMKNAGGEIIYVGKAKNLKHRLPYYFSGRKDLPDKTARQVAETDSVEFIVTDNEVEALILESNLIKKNRPKYNIDLKDSFRYAYVLATDEEYPRLLVVRRLTGREKGKVFGPYVFGEPRAIAIGAIRKIFRIRTCRQQLPKRECLLYHIGQCSAPCIGAISKDDYHKNVESAVKILEGDASSLLGELEKNMDAASKAEKFEEALKLREQIEAISWVSNQKQKVELRKTYDEDVVGFACDRKRTCAQVFNIVRGVIRQRKTFHFDFDQNQAAQFLKEYYSYAPLPDEIILARAPEDWRALEEYFKKKTGKTVKIVVPKIGTKASLLRLVEKNAAIALNETSPPELAELKTALHLPLLPSVMECFDISNLGETNAVAGMAQFVDGKPNKGEYRRFRIKSFVGQNDFGAIKEVVFRRYYRLKKENAEFPNLIVIDGGKGQLHAAMEALLELGESDVPIISLAKKNEEVHLPTRSMPVALDRKSGALKLLQAARDEAHRFARKYHELLRGKAALEE